MTTQTTTATFKAGDSILCPLFNDGNYTVQGNKDGLFIDYDSNSDFLYFDELGQSTSLKFNFNSRQIVFHDTPANRQAIATLYHDELAPQVTHAVTPQVKQINLARPDDTEVITMGAFDVSNLACDFSGIADTLDDISTLLFMIHTGQIDHDQAKAMARISQCNVETWSNASYASLKRLNVALKQSSFGEGQA